MAPKVTVYSTPLCMPCRFTKRLLDRAGVAYEDIDVSLHRDAHEHVCKLGYTQTPVVTVELPDGLDHWSGHKESKLEALVALADRAAR